MHKHIWEVYDTRNGRRIVQCSHIYDAINLCNMHEFRSYREYPQQTLSDQVIDVLNLHKTELMPSQQCLDPTPFEYLKIKANEQQPVQFNN